MEAQKGTFTAVGGSFLPACGDSGCRRRKVAHPNQIVGGECQSEYPVDSQESAVTRLAQPGDGLEPTKDFFYTFALLLTNRVARMTSGAIIDDAGQLARNVGSDLVVTQLLHEVLAIVSLVGTQCDPMLAGNFFHHRHRGLRLGVAVSRSHATVDRQAVAILHQHVPCVRQLGLRAWTLTGPPRLGSVVDWWVSLPRRSPY
jgi:hypothetical protein